MDTLRETILTELDERLRSYKVFWSSDATTRSMRLFRHPIKILVRKLMLLKWFKNHPFKVSSTTFFGYPMRIFSLEQELWFEGALLSAGESRFTRFLVQDLQEEDVFFDIGSHHGYYTLLAHTLIAKGGGEIHAFEPVAVHYPLLHENVRKLRGVVANNIAIYSRSGTLELDESVLGRSTINASFFDGVKRNKDVCFVRRAVPCITLDEYCEKHRVRPTILKIDVEGSEFDVLSGGRKTLEISGLRIVMEVWNAPYENSNHLKAVALLREIGYRMFRINPDGLSEEISDFDPVHDLPPCVQSDNFLFKV